MNTSDLPWPPRCADTFCRNPQCNRQIAILAELSYLVYDPKQNKFIRLCPKCYAGEHAPSAA